MDKINYLHVLKKGVIFRCVRENKIPIGAMKIVWGAEIALTAKSVFCSAMNGLRSEVPQMRSDF